MKHLRRWGAIYILLGLFVGSSAGQLAAQAGEARADAQTHGQPWSWGEVWVRFAAATFENWQSEFLQLVVQAALLLGPLGAVVWRADRNADKDDIGRLERDLARLDRKIERVLRGPYRGPVE